MRLWSINPKYLDKAGLGGCWREALLALKVLMGKTKGYKNHPQLDRIKNTNNPIFTIQCFLVGVWEEAINNRKYNYDYSKIHLEKGKEYRMIKLEVNKGQVDFEVRHLQKKLLCRDFNKCCELSRDKLKGKVELHRMFVEIPGEIEEWEKN
jgi:hypothetical protein